MRRISLVRCRETSETRIVKTVFCMTFFLVALLYALPAKPFAVDFDGRIRPQNSFELLLSQRICESRKCAGISPGELFSKIQDGEADSLEVFRVNRAAAVEILHLDENRRNFCRRDFEQSRSLLRQYAERDDDRPLTREFIRLDAALDLYDSIRSESFVKRISVDLSGLTLTENRQVRAESLYLNINLPFVLWILACIAFSASLAFFFEKRFSWKLAASLEFLMAGLCFAIFVFRAFVENRLPLASLYEMLLLIVFGVSVAFPLLAVLTRMRSLVVCGSGIALAILLVMRSALNGDAFSPVSVLLDSPFWLSLHVFTIACGFCLLLVSSLIAHVSLLRRALELEISDTLHNVLWKTLSAGFLFSSLGILLGGFWADVAWGRFWGWDPKENGALLVILWVLTVGHLKWGNLVRAKTLDAMLSLLSVVILFCLLGVNLLGVGLHSYGYSPGLFFSLCAFVLMDILYVAFFSLWKKDSSKKLKLGE